jgi:hypothetical protein
MRPRTAIRAAALAVLVALFGAARANAALPSAPIVVPSALSTGTVQWAWNITDNTTGYRVLSSTGGGNISGDLSAATTFFALTGLSTNTAAAVTIEAFSSSGTADSSLTTAFSAAATPTGSLLLGTNNTAVSLSWQVNGNPAGTTYEVFWSSSGGTPVIFSTTPAVIVAIGSASATVPDLPSGFTLYFQVLAVNNQGAQTPLDVQLSTYIPPLGGQPMISSGTYALGISSIAWSWAPSTGALNYQLFNATGGIVSPLLPPTQFSFIQTGLTPNTSYMNYVTAFSTDSFGVPTSTNSAPFARYTLAAQTFGLTAAGLQNNLYENLVWNANGNPSYTSYNVSWWTSVTSTVTYSTTAVNASAGVLPAGGTVYFTVQAMNGEGILAAYDQTLFTAVPSTYFAVGVTTIPPNFSGVLTFAVPTGPIYLTISSATFPSQAAIAIVTPSVIPAASGRLTAVPGVPGYPGINFSITAYDPFGNPMQPLLPIAINITLQAAAVAGFSPTTLTVARYDVPHSAWVPLITQRGGNTISALTEHLTQFAVLSVTAPTDLSGITVGPNPLRPYLNPGQVFTFRNLPPDTRIRVFDYVGEKLADVTADASGLASWDGRSRRGGYVGSGVYIAIIEGAGTKKTMRLAIER